MTLGKHRGMTRTFVPFTPHRCSLPTWPRFLRSIMHNATTETEQDQPGAKHTGGSNTRTPCPLVTFRSASTDESALILARHGRRHPRYPAARAYPVVYSPVPIISTSIGSLPLRCGGAPPACATRPCAAMVTTHNKLQTGPAGCDPCKILHHGYDHRIIQFMHAREFGARVDQNRRPLLLEPILTIVLPHSAVWSFPFREMFA